MYASCHGRREARRAVTALLRNQFPLRRIHVLSASPEGLARVQLKWRHLGAHGALTGAAVGVVLMASAWAALSPLSPWSLTTPAPWTPWTMALPLTPLLIVAAAYVGYRLGQGRRRLSIVFPRRLPEQAEILVGLYANHRQARATRAAFKSAQMGRTYVAHQHRRATKARDHVPSS